MKAKAPKVYNHNLDPVIEGSRDITDDYGINAQYEACIQDPFPGDFDYLGNRLDYLSLQKQSKVKASDGNFFWLEYEDYIKMDLNE